MLIVPQHQFQATTTNVTASTTPGTQITAGASNVMGTVVDLFGGTALPWDCWQIAFGLSDNFAATTDTSTLAEIMIDPAGGTTWASSGIYLPAGYVGTVAAANLSLPRIIVFPLFIPAGTTIGCRGQNVTGSTRTFRVQCWAWGRPRNPSQVWAGRRVTTYGADLANSRGTAHTSGTSGSFSSWADFPAATTTTYRHKALAFAVQGSGADTTMQANGMIWRLGISSTQISPDMYCMCSTTENMGGPFPSMPIYRDVAAGTQIQIQAAASTGTADAIDVMYYGIS